MSDPNTEAVEQSLAEHEAQFGATALRETPAHIESDIEPEPEVQSPPRTESKRARSHRAGSADAETIAAMTKRLRDAESDLGLNIEKQPDESDRVFALRRQAEIAEALRDARKAPKSEAAQVITPIAAPQAEAFTEAEPKFEDFLSEADAQTAYTRALARYDRRKETHEEHIRAAQTYGAQQQQAVIRKIKQDHDTRENAFKAAHPDYDDRAKKAFEVVGQLPPLLTTAILTDDKGPELVYYFAQQDHLDELAEMALLAHEKAVDERSVALMRRRLHARATGVASTGALTPAPKPQVVLARPPTPVRTGPTATGSADVPDEDTESLSQFEARVYRNRRGARR